ncbi:hypothetical protein [Pseudomonas syringae]|uniref:hypothetical protein n=1 Tax=Pseudomonas syringae TaxID=317 RepID=UPI001267F190|nr:hypothetical protein [Pseudomonas syringae]
MSYNERVDQLIMQVLRDTSEGRVSWLDDEPPRYLSFATDDVIPAYYTAHYGSVQIAVYEVRYKYYHDEEAYSWSSEARFAILNDGQVVHDQRHTSPALNNLFHLVRSRAGGLDSILDGLLK